MSLLTRMLPRLRSRWRVAGIVIATLSVPDRGRVAGARRRSSAAAARYAEFWHQNAINGKQYGFPYDDDAGQSSDISVTNPQYMVVAVGW
jgi:Beta-1,3-glucanase